MYIEVHHKGSQDFLCDNCFEAHLIFLLILLKLRICLTATEFFSIRESTNALLILM